MMVGLVASIVVDVAAEAWSWQARLVLALVVGVPYLIDDCHHDSVKAVALRVCKMVAPARRVPLQ